MDKAQQQLIKTYYRKRAIAAKQSKSYKYKPYEYTKYALDNKILDLSVLDIGELYDIYSTNPNIKEYVKPYVNNYNEKSSGLLKILIKFINTKNPEELILFIDKSEFINDKDIDFDVNDNYITFVVDENIILTHLDLDDDYDHIVSMANSPYIESSDSDEANYMHYTLSSNNINKIKEIAKKMGVKDDEIKSFSGDDGAINDFLEEHKFLESIIDTFLYEHGEAKGLAESKAAEKQLESFVLDIDNYETSIKIKDLLKFIYDNDLKNINTFDDFLYSVENNHDLSSENIHEELYHYVNYDELNYEINNELETIIDNLDDPNSDIHEYVQGYYEVQSIIKKYGFGEDDRNGIIATRDQTDKIIHIIDYGYSESDVLQLKIELVYKDDNKRRTGWIPIKKIGNYIDQSEFKSMRE